LTLQKLPGETAVLAYSGGLDTSVAINWIKERYSVDVVTATVDVGQEENLEEATERALLNGALRSYLIDAKDEFAERFIAPALKANSLYEGKYPLSTALARPLIAAKVAALAHALGARYVAHGCTGKGNDQVRFELTFRALKPDLEIIAPIREWKMNREEELEYARAHGIKLKRTVPSRYSTDENLWGRSIEGGELEDEGNEPPEEIYEWTSHPDRWPKEPEYVTVLFEKGVPVSLNGEKMKLAELITRLNKIAGSHGVGRIDHIEDRVVGIKSRENYECPAAITLINAHRALESLVLSRELLSFKQLVEQRFAELVYAGMWYSDIMKALLSFLDTTQEDVSGEVKVKLFSGVAAVASLRSERSRYSRQLSTYGKGDVFDQKAAEGFIYILSLPLRSEGNLSQELSLSNVKERTLERKVQGGN
jgi:argininosuccinate synthase